METGQRDPRRLGVDRPAAPEVDEALRRSLAPHPLAVERLVRRALAGRPIAPGRRRWKLAAAAAAVVLLLAFLIPDPSPPPPAGGDAAPKLASTEPARVSISNAGGDLTISSTLGSKWILVSGDDS